MIEKVNPSHPDKVADRIAGAIVDLAYKKQDNPKIAVEVLIGHGSCHIIAETSVHLENAEIDGIVYRISGIDKADYKEVEQDKHLAYNQNDGVRCGDNGIFKGVPVTDEERTLTNIARDIYAEWHSDGKYILAKAQVDFEKPLHANQLIICQSNMGNEKPDLIKLDEIIKKNLDADTYFDLETIVNPLGFWTGGTDVDTGATNRKLGSDMGHAVTGGGLHGKDLSKADVSVNIYAFLKAQCLKQTVELHCTIGDETIDGEPYSEIVKIARGYIMGMGGFEKFAEWGLL